MVTLQKAYELAKSYTSDLGEVLPEFYFDIRFNQEFRESFYFDFIIVDKNGDTPKEPPMIGGAPGVIVNKITGAVKTVSFGELSKLR